jgi:hypothetical protein
VTTTIDDPEAIVVAEELRTLCLREPQRFDVLAMFPLCGPDAEPQYLTLSEALARKRVSFSEVSPRARVHELLFRNPTRQQVLLLDGDELVGAKQDRVLTSTVLIPPRTTLRIPVACVERGRWWSARSGVTHEDRTLFARARAENMAAVDASLRAAGERRTDQLEIWRLIGAKVAGFRADAKSEAMAELYRHLRSPLGEYVSAFSAEVNQVGAVFLAYGRAVGLDLFDSTRTMRATLPRLVASYAVDALETPRRLVPAARMDLAQSFLKQVAEMPGTRFAGVGLGAEFRLRAPGLVGEALVANGRLVHVSALPTPRDDARQRSLDLVNMAA